MSEPFLGQLMLFPFGFAPKNWALCNGALLQISKFQALFSLLGTTYGGDGRTTFGLPDLRGRTPISSGQLAGGGNYPLGQMGGEELHTLNTSEVPPHNHNLQGVNAAANAFIPANNLLANTAGALTIYQPNPTSGSKLAPASMANAGGSQAHENRTPFLAMTWCIALTGIFPTRN